MHPENVFQKTPKGREEIEKRTFRIDFKRRTLLILVDGRSTAATLAEKAAHIPDGLALLQSLWTEGFVESVGTAATELARPPSDRALEDLKRTACRTIERLMGPDSDAIALRLERAPNHEAFFAEASKARDLLRSLLGPRQAEEFWKSLGGQAALGLP